LQTQLVIEIPTEQFSCNYRVIWLSWSMYLLRYCEQGSLFSYCLSTNNDILEM